MSGHWLVKFLENYWKRERQRVGDWKPPRNPSCLALLCHGGIGDTLMCTPAIRALKESFPRCRVIVVVHHKKEAILKNNPHIDRLLMIRKSFISYSRLYFFLKSERPEAVVLFHGNDPLVYALFHKACPGVLIGFETDNPLTFLLNKTLPFDNDRHVIENNLELIGLVGAYTQDLRMNLANAIDSQTKADALLKSFMGGKRLVGFHLGTNFPGKCWALENFAELGKRLIKERNLVLMIFGSATDRILVETFCREFGKKAYPMIINLSITASVMTRLNVLVTPDTGPMHMAFALNCPTVALFGPTNPKNYGALTEVDHHKVIHKVSLDRPTIKIHNDPEDRMGKISVDEVYQAVVHLLGRRP